MEERKFNIGDRVVCIDKQYYDNIEFPFFHMFFLFYITKIIYFFDKTKKK